MRTSIIGIQYSIEFTDEEFEVLRQVAPRVIGQIVDRIVKGYAMVFMGKTVRITVPGDNEGLAKETIKQIRLELEAFIANPKQRKTK